MPTCACSFCWIPAHSRVPQAQGHENFFDVFWSKITNYQWLLINFYAYFKKFQGLKETINKQKQWGWAFLLGTYMLNFVPKNCHRQMQWLSGRVLDLRPKGHGFEPHRHHCVVSLSMNIHPRLVLVQPRKTHPYTTERLLMGCKESNQSKHLKILSAEVACICICCM